MTRDRISDEEIKRRHADIPQDGLFEMAAPEAKGSEESGRRKPAKPRVIKYVECPECTNKKVAVISIYRDGHLTYVYRAHDRVTRKGHRFQCPASNEEV